MTPFYYNTFLNKFKLPCHKTCHSRECGGYPLGHPECKSPFYVSCLTPSILYLKTKIFATKTPRL